MKKVVSFSMGRSSARLVLLAIDKWGVDNVDVVLMDTGAEHPMSYKFAREMAEHFGINVTCLRGDFSYPLGKGVGFNVVELSECSHDLKSFKEMMAKYGTPYIGGMFCTDRMKLQPFKKYCDKTYGKKNYETILGIRADEPKRLREKPFVSYLADICDDDKQDILDFWSEQVFDLEIEEWNGNCVFCPKKSNLKLAAAQRDNPDLYVKWLDMIKDHPVRRVDSRTINLMKSKGVKEYKLLSEPLSSEKLINAARKYNENLFTSKNKKWKSYEDEASLIMYRGNQSLESLISTFDGSTGNEIKARIRGGHHTDTNSCSESCEVFS